MIKKVGLIILFFSLVACNRTSVDNIIPEVIIKKEAEINKTEYFLPKQFETLTFHHNQNILNKLAKNNEDTKIKTTIANQLVSSYKHIDFMANKCYFNVDCYYEIVLKGEKDEYEYIKKYYDYKRCPEADDKCYFESINDLFKKIKKETEEELGEKPKIIKDEESIETSIWNKGDVCLILDLYNDESGLNLTFTATMAKGGSDCPMSK